MYVKDIEDIMKALHKDATDVKRRLTSLRQVMELEWHLSVLQLPQLCDEELQERKYLGIQHDRSCADLHTIRKELASGHGEADRLDNRKWQDLKTSIEYLKKHAEQEMKFRDDCKRLDCKQGTCRRKADAYCDCRAGWEGTSCGIRIPDKVCVYYTETQQSYNAKKEVEQHFDDIHGWIRQAGQAKCMQQDRSAQYVDKISNHWTDSNDRDVVKFVCKHTEACTPRQRTEDCCKDRMFNGRLRSIPSHASQIPTTLDESLKRK